MALIFAARFVDLPQMPLLWFQMNMVDQFVNEDQFVLIFDRLAHLEENKPIP